MTTNETYARLQRQGIIVAALLLCLIGLGTLSSNQALRSRQNRNKVSIIGHWASPYVEQRPGRGGTSLFLKRDFTNTALRSIALLQFYNDAKGADPSLSIQVEGPYEIVQPSTDVPGAFEANFRFDTAKITPESDNAVSLLNSAKSGTCGQPPWHIHTEQNVTMTGCAPLGIDLKKHNIEYDIVRVDGNNLFYGQRPSDGSAPDLPQKRPKALQTPLARVK